ncbi:hypothetical protein ACFV23_06810 [Streptomyces sp. NPDC059627]
MKRRTLPAVTALATTAALLLTACGGEGSKAGGGDAKASESPSADNTVARPEITLPSDLTDTFESRQTGDAAKDAVLGDVTRRINATNYAITRGDPELAALGFYYSGGALADAKDWVESIAKDGYSITGTNRYYNVKIDVFDSASASVVYCEDQSKAFAKVRKSGKIIKTPVNDDSYVLYTTRLEKNEQGVWQTTKLTSERGNRSCTP